MRRPRNHGEGNWDQTDWRDREPPVEAQLDRLTPGSGLIVSELVPPASRIQLHAIIRAIVVQNARETPSKDARKPKRAFVMV